MKNALPSGRASDLYRRAAKAYYNTDSVVNNDSIIRHKKQDNDKFKRFSCKFKRFLVSEFRLHPNTLHLSNNLFFVYSGAIFQYPSVVD